MCCLKVNQKRKKVRIEVTENPEQKKGVDKNRLFTSKNKNKQLSSLPEHCTEPQQHFELFTLTQPDRSYAAIMSIIGQCASCQLGSLQSEIH